MKTDPDASGAFDRGDPAATPNDRTAQITQDLERDIINFLSGKYTDNATLTVAEIMKFYDCSGDRARRVLKGLVSQRVLAPAGSDTYRVLI